MIQEPWLLNSTSRLLSSTSQLLNSTSRLWNSTSQLLNFTSRLLNSTSQLLNSTSRLLNSTSTNDMPIKMTRSFSSFLKIRQLRTSGRFYKTLTFSPTQVFLAIIWRIIGRVDLFKLDNSIKPETKVQAFVINLNTKVYQKGLVFRKEILTLSVRWRGGKVY